MSGPKDSSPGELSKTAERIVKRLKTELSEKKPAGLSTPLLHHRDQFFAARDVTRGVPLLIADA